MSDPNLESAFQRSALDYHEAEPPGKIAIQATKPLANQRDLALAYSPGVAHACMAIAEDPAAVARLTAARQSRRPWSLTAPPCSGSATSGRWRRSR